jgi:hypothetical protein
MIRKQRDTYSWDFVFLGANQDAIATAASMNIPMNVAMTYNAGTKGVANVYAAVGQQISANRATGQSINFTKQNRADAMQKDVQDEDDDTNLVNKN